MKRKVKTASCGCVVRKVHASYRRQGWKCAWETQGNLCESPAEVWVTVRDGPPREGNVYCHIHLMSHTVICGHPTEHLINEMVPVVPVVLPINDVPEWLTSVRALSLDEIIEFQRKLEELY